MTIRACPDCGLDGVGDDGKCMHCFADVSPPLPVQLPIESLCILGRTHSIDLVGRVVRIIGERKLRKSQIMLDDRKVLAYEVEFLNPKLKARFIAEDHQLTLWARLTIATVGS